MIKSLLPFFIQIFSTSLKKIASSLALCCLWLVGLLAVHKEAQAQQNSVARPVDLLPAYFIPKSPTVATLQRFDAQKLVDLPTGGSQLAIPLAEVACGALHLPVSLAYSYTGLRVYQPTDLIGLGWVLQAGASITRQVNGLVDDAVSGDNTRRYAPTTVTNGATQQDYLKRAYESDVDTGPDIYSFSLPTGVNGRFVVYDTAVVLFPQQPVHIRRLEPALGAVGGRGFQITTEDGVRFLFQATEWTEPNPNNFGKIALHSSAWQLTQMISTDNSDTIRLHYTSYKAPLPQQCALTTGRYFTGQYAPLGNAGNYGADCGSSADYSFHNAYTYVSRVTAQYLDSITTRGTHLILTRRALYQPAGQGQPHNKEINQVRLLTTTGGRREIRRFTFYRSAFTGATPTEYRLRLDSLQESANNLALPAYHFQYYNNGDLPARGSAAQDYWGYANGAVSNGSFQTTTTNPTLLADPHLNVAGVRPADRKPNFEAAIEGALKQVKYPTGGTSYWEYEPGRMAADITDIPTDTLATEIDNAFDPANFQYLPGRFYKKITPSGKVTFQVPEQSTVLLTLERRPFDTEHNYGISNTYRDFNIWRRLATKDTLITNLPDSLFPGAYRVRDPIPARRFTFHLPPGTYVAQVYCEQLEAHTSISIHVPYHDSTQVKLGVVGPGIRVARTKTITKGAPALVHTYQYSAGGSSSGISLLPLAGKGFDQYEYVEETLVNNKTYTIGSACHIINTSSDNRGLGNEFNKYDFYYASVTERDSIGQGATVSSFVHLPQQFNDVVLVDQARYRQVAAQAQQLVEVTHYTYATDSVTTYPLLRVHELVKHLDDPTYATPHLPDSYTPQAYEVQTGFRLPLSTAQFLYDAQQALHAKFTYTTYERQRIRQTATRTSTGWDIQRYKRLSDYSVNPVVTALRVNSFNPVIETQNWHRSMTSTDSLLVAGYITLYDPAWRSPASTYQLRIDRPQLGLNQESQVNGKYTNLLSDTRYEQRASVRYAAGSGDLIQHQPTHGRPTSFLTGYERTLVIAEAKNAAFAQIAYTSFEPEAAGRWIYDSTGTHRVLGGRTGRWAYQLDGTANVARGQLPAGDYELTYWLQGASPLSITVQSGNLQVSGSQLIATTPTNWYQYRTRLHFNTLGLVSLDIMPGASAVHLDEVRLYPVGAQLTTYTHDPLVGPTSQTDPTGRTTFYEYDALGRLLRTRDEQGRILSQQQYHYAQP